MTDLEVVDFVTLLDPQEKLLSLMKVLRSISLTVVERNQALT